MQCNLGIKKYSSSNRYMGNGMTIHKFIRANDLSAIVTKMSGATAFACDDDIADFLADAFALMRGDSTFFGTCYSVKVEYHHDGFKLVGQLNRNWGTVRDGSLIEVLLTKSQYKELLCLLETFPLDERGKLA